MKFLDYTRLFITAIIVIILDQWTKVLVRQLPLGEVWMPQGLAWLTPYARIVHWYNTGAAFGSFPGFGMVFTILAFVVVAFIIYYFKKIAGEFWWMQVAMGMQMGGAIGNVIDRLTNDMKVTDFISVGSFAVFNVADSAITVGTAILVLGMLYIDKQEAQRAAELAIEEDAVIDDFGDKNG